MLQCNTCPLLLLCGGATAANLTTPYTHLPPPTPTKNVSEHSLVPLGMLLTRHICPCQERENPETMASRSLRA